MRVKLQLMLFVFCLIVFGCGPSLAPVYPVKGQVVAGPDKKPAAGAMVYFNPVTKDPREKGIPLATVDDNGYFELTTRKAKDGAPAGEYVITLVWFKTKKSLFDDEGADKLNGRFAD